MIALIQELYFSGYSLYPDHYNMQRLQRNKESTLRTLLVTQAKLYEYLLQVNCNNILTPNINVFYNALD